MKQKKKRKSAHKCESCTSETQVSGFQPWEEGGKVDGVFLGDI